MVFEIIIGIIISLVFFCLNSVTHIFVAVGLIFLVTDIAIFAFMSFIIYGFTIAICKYKIFWEENKMKRICKIFAVLLVMVIALFSFYITAGATEVSNTQDGLVVSITSEKDSYKANEDIELTFKVTNTNDFAVENVSLEAIIPDGLTLKSSADTTASTVSLASGDSLELTLIALKESSVITVPIGDGTELNKENPTHTQPVATEATENTTIVQIDSIQAATTKVNSATTDNTAIKTGNTMSYLLAGLICLVCLAVAVISFRFRKKAVKYLSFVLCVCIAVGSVAFVGVTNTMAQETTQQMSFEVSKTITVDNEEYKINAIIKYAEQTENSDDEFVPSRDADRYVNDDLYTTNPDKSHKAIDKDTGVQFVNNELLIYVEDNTTQENIEKLCKQFNAYIVGKNKTLSSYKLRFNDSYSYSELKQIMNKIQQEEMINESSLNLVIHYDTNEYYPTSKEDRWTNDWNSIPSGANWGVEAIKAPQAWEYMDLMQEVNVGVYDQGFDTNHKDLKNVIKTSSLYPANPTDHGTHVTGIIGADFENGMGINGVCPTAHFSLYNYSENDSDSDSFNYAMTYLIDKNKCKVINMSLNSGSECMFAASKGELSAQEYLKAISSDFEKVLKKLATNNDFVICRSAGNNRGKNYYKSDEAPYGYYLADDEGNYLDRELGKYLKWNGKSPISGSNQSMADWDSLSLISDEEIKNHIITVGAIKNESDTTAKYSLCNFSDIGNVVDVVAPGYDIESTVSDNRYELQNGTSMASPHVAGIAAMLYSLNPDLTGDEVKRIILETATTEVDGYKLVDAEAAVKEVLGQGSLSGEVVSSDNNAGLSNVRVDAYLKLKSGTQYVGNTYTNDSGSFSMELQGGSYELRFNKEDYETATTAIMISKDVMTVLKEPIILKKTSSEKYDGKCGDNLYWLLEDNGALIISGYGDMYDFNNVTDIPWYNKRSEITSVELPDGLTSVGDSAFWNCSNLAKVDIPNSVISIGYSAFRDCYNLKWVSISDKAKKIDDFAFEQCNNLCSVKIGYAVEEIGDSAFSECKKLESVIIPYGVKKIGNKTFYSCDNLEYIRIPSSVTEIGNNAFANIASSYNLKVYENTYAYEYAINNKLTFSYGYEPESVSIYDGNKSSENYGAIISSIKLNVGESYYLKAMAFPRNTLENGTITAPDTDFSWSISDTDMVYITNNTIALANYNDEAVIEAKSKGKATITLKTSNGKVATCEVIVD